MSERIDDDTLAEMIRREMPWDLPDTRAIRGELWRARGAEASLREEVERLRGLLGRWSRFYKWTSQETWEEWAVRQQAVISDTAKELGP